MLYMIKNKIEKLDATRIRYTTSQVAAAFNAGFIRVASQSTTPPTAPAPAQAQPIVIKAQPNPMPITITSSAGTASGSTVWYIPSGYAGVYPNAYQTSISFPIVIDEEVAEAKPVSKKRDRDGCDCTKCKEFFPYAESPDDKDFVCYSCKLDW